MLRQSRLILFVASLALVAGVASATTYTITDLGTLSGGTASYAMAVNDYGEPVGCAYDSGGTPRAAVYTGGAWVDIGSGFMSAKKTYATGINDNGQVTGWDKNSAVSQVGDTFIWQSGVGYTDVGAQTGVVKGYYNRNGINEAGVSNYFVPGAINSNGAVAGTWVDANSLYRTYVYSGGSTTEVTTPAAGGAGNALVSAMNDAGVVAGWYQVGGNPVGVGFYNDGTCHTISGMSYPFAITGNYVVGQDYASVDAQLYTLGNAAATDLGRLAGYASGSAAYGVNSTGTTVVGTSWNASTNCAFLYSGGTMLTLNTLVTGTDPFSSLQYATAISANGTYIVGYGTVGSQTHGFLLTAAATPEPSALLLVATGLAGLLAYAWRRRK